MFPILTGNVLSFPDLPSGTVVHITDPLGRMTKWLVDRGDLLLWEAGTYGLGVQLPPDAILAEIPAPYEAPSVTVPEDPAVALAAWREEARMPKEDFAIAARKAGLVTAQEAEDYATGQGVPAIITLALSLIPDADARADARIKMRAATEVHRSSPLLALAQRKLGLTDDQVDALFGGPPA